MSKETKVHFKAHAQDDSATTGENQFVVIDVLANDRGSASTIFSLDQNDPTNEFRSAILPSGATVQTTGIQHMVVYKPGTGFDYLAEGETATDSFTYTIRLADGSFSTATVEVLITGTNDPAVLSSEYVKLTEGDSAEDISTSGTLTISDVDSPELFVAGTQEGVYGTFTIDENGNWTYTASSAHDEFQDTNTYGEVFFVQSVDGTTTFVDFQIMGTGNEPEMIGATANPDFAF
ncbi:MAG TPA: VCBS domain-containing protein [Allosphingosinicella sp.]|nr:VCBS domain-containing protein [Allosphingosinicella sp.]